MKRALIHVSARRRGSVFVLVVAILAVLALLSLSLTYATRMELAASRNFVDQIQGRTSVFTGVPPFAPGDRDPPVVGFGMNNPDARTTRLGQVPGLGSFNQDVFAMGLQLDGEALDAISATSGEVLRDEDELESDRGGRGDSRYTRASMTSVERRLAREAEDEERERAELDDAAYFLELASFQTNLTQGRIEDESAKVNVNTIIPAPSKGEQIQNRLTLDQIADARRPGPAGVMDTAALGAFIDKIFHQKGVHADANGRELAENIVKLRYGADGKPGDASIDDDGDAGMTNPNVDGRDNDQDGTVDNLEEETFAINADGLDNDRDGEYDEADETIEKDGLDNNFDGEIDEPGEGMDEPDEFSPDLRLRARGDDQPFGSLADLMRVEGMTPEALAALAPYLTVFSVSAPAYPVGDINQNRGRRQIDPNTAAPAEMFSALRESFPYLPEELVGQFVTNIIDRRDPDDIPSRIDLGSLGKTFIGFELTPRINEVGPYTGGSDQNPDGDDGQFVEIVNPHQKSVSLNGWRLEGVGMNVYLDGTLQPGGILVVTDDYNNGEDPEPEDYPGEGSLYDVFGATPGGGARLKVEPFMTLPDDEGEVRLINDQGVEVDSFRYRQGRIVGSGKRTFQRLDALTRKAIYERGDAKRGTPFRKNLNVIDRSSVDQTLLDAIEKFQNQPFRSPLEILLVMTNYEEVLPEDLRGSGVVVTPTPQAPVGGWSGAEGLSPDEEEREWAEQAQSIRLPGLGGGEERNFSFGVLDMFMPGVTPRRQTQIFSSAAFGSSNTGDPLSSAPDENERRNLQLRDQPPPVHGRLNVNTAPGALLAALPGMDDSLAFRIVYLRNGWIRGTLDPAEQIPREAGAEFKSSAEWLAAAPPVESPRWRRLSDLLTDEQLWGQADLFKRIEVLYPVSRMLTFHTQALSVEMENLPNPSPDDSNRLATVLRSGRIIAGDRGRPETVVFQMGPALDFSGYDKDIAYGLPAGELDPEMDPLQPAPLKWADSKEAAERNAQIESMRGRLDQRQRREEQRIREIEQRNREAARDGQAQPASGLMNSGVAGRGRGR